MVTGGSGLSAQTIPNDRVRRSKRRPRLLLTAHVWLGLFAAAFVTIMSLSGCIIVFRHNLEYRSAPRIAAAPGRVRPVDAAVLANRIKLFRPDGTMTRIVFPEAADEPLLVELLVKPGQRLEIYCDPFTGAVIGARKQTAWLDWIVSLHHNLLLGKLGRAMTGVIGIALLLLSLSGLINWLFGPRNWRTALALPYPGPLRRMAYPLHRSAGLWMNGILIVISVTGIGLAYAETVKQLADSIGGGTARVRKADRSSSALKGEESAALPLEQYVSATQGALPEGSMRELRMPERGGNAVTALFSMPGDLRSKGSSSVTLDPASAKVIATESFPSMQPSEKLFYVVTLIHFVEWGGWPVKIAWCLFGLSPTVLTATGIAIWWIRRRAPVNR